jgi:hypothetical protein
MTSKTATAHFTATTEHIMIDLFYDTYQFNLENPDGKHCKKQRNCYGITV